MRIDIQHRFEGARIQQVEQLYMLDEAFNHAAFERIGYTRRLQARELNGGSLRRSLCLSPHRPLPPPFGSLAPGGLFQIGEHIVYDLQTHRGSWRTVPSVLASQFEAGGELSFEQVDNAVLFRLAGQVEARIPLLGGLAERQALRTAEGQHAALAEQVRAELHRSAAVAPLQASS
jgi:hypothetical protein